MNPITMQNSSFKRVISHLGGVVLPMVTMDCGLHSIINFEASCKDTHKSGEHFFPEFLTMRASG